jgi:hypothetical protein
LIDAPLHFFNVLLKEPAITKAALLLEEHIRSIFSPAAVFGFDFTTSRRLRIPIDEVEGDYVPKEPWMLPDDSREFLRPYLSVREFDDNPALGFVPFRLDGHTRAILIFTADESSDNGDQGHVTSAYVDSFASRKQDISSILAGARPDLQDGRGFASPEEAKSTTEQELGKAEREQRTLLFLYFDYNSLLKSLQELCRECEPYFFYRELLRLTAHYFRNSGHTIATGQNSALIVLESKRAKKGRLLVHQLVRHLGAYFSDHVTFPEPAFQQKNYPGDGSSADDFLKGYL